MEGKWRVEGKRGSRKRPRVVVEEMEVPVEEMERGERNGNLWRLLILESNISEISNSISLSMMTGGGRVSVRFGNLLGVEGSKIETWKMGWMLRMELGRRRVKEMEPT